MTMNPLPPQAYTKDSLLKAYAWLQNQPANIRELASTPDVLVSLYLKAQRDGDHALQTPSIQNFQKELKSLAGIMGEFDKGNGASTPTPAATKPAPAAVDPVLASFFPSLREQAPAQQAAPQIDPAFLATPAPTSQTAPAQSRAQQASVTAENVPTNFDVKSLIAIMDEDSQQLIREVKKTLNLSSDMEALRAAIKVGSQQIRGLFNK